MTRYSQNLYSMCVYYVYMCVCVCACVCVHVRMHAYVCVCVLVKDDSSRVTYQRRTRFSADITRSATVTEGGVHGCSVDGIGQVNR